ncbi:DUF6221 family protein, partial [Streptomyces sp. NPDC001880]
MTDNSDMIDFVRERLAEEERIAQAAGGDSWRCPADVPGEVHDRSGAITFSLRNLGFDQHIALQDPARTLRRIETSRVLLDEYAEIADLDTDRPEHDFGSGRAVGEALGGLEGGENRGLGLDGGLGRHGFLLVGTV